MAWKPVYASLMFFETLTVYVAALGLERCSNEGYRKLLVGFGIGVNLSLLFVFKYYKFFEVQTREFGLGFNLPLFEVILPMGISFYTFHALSYIIDVYRGHVRTERHPGVLMLYIAYFPLLVAGPIARASHLLPQLHSLCANFEYERVVSGLRLMLLGFFKKIVMADNLALIVSPVYAAPAEYSGISALVATVAFAFQIFFDFSAYTDIARGASRILGIELNQNFLRPYFASSIPEFWRRWHISLSTWFRDYLYIPLGGNRVAQWRWFLNLWIVFVLCGLWHGANWTFLIWGALHGFYFFLTYFLTPPARWLTSRTVLSHFPKFCHAVLVLFTFSLVCWAWVMFRAETLEQALIIWRNIAAIPLEVGEYLMLVVRDGLPFAPLAASGLGWLIYPMDKLSLMPVYMFVLVGCYFILAFQFRMADDGNGFTMWSLSRRWGAYVFALIGILLLGRFGAAQFLYFQF